jgi:Spy/CpxP family protein refolding chaperone
VWKATLVHTDARAVLIPEQIKIFDQHRAGRRSPAKSAIDALPELADELATLWSKLELSPNQVDALGVVLKFVMRHKHSQHRERHEDVRADIEKILTPEQWAIAVRFHDGHVAEFEARFLKMAEERERFHDALDLTGEQKIEVVRIVLGDRARIASVIREVAVAAKGLHEAAHGEPPDRAAAVAAGERFGDAMGHAAALGAGLVASARDVLTQEQMDVLQTHVNRHLQGHLEHARIIPARVHEVIGFLNELNLTAEQKDRIVALIAEKHAQHHGRQRAMKGLL